MMPTAATFFELRRGPDAPILAVVFRNGRRALITRLPDGAIVETPTSVQRFQAPQHPDVFLELGHGGVPASMHHRCLGLVTGFASFAGVFLLATGDIAAIYGAEALPIDEASSS